MSNPRCQVELHCHTVFSKDGLIDFESLIGTAARIGLNALAITDHDTIEGAMAFRRQAEARGLALKIIVGEEKTLSDGSHLIGLFLEQPIESGELKQAIAEIAGQGGLCLIPHPFRKKDGLFRDGLERVAFFNDLPAGFEIFNAKCSYAENSRARDLLSTTLSPFGGSDAHYESDLGECLNLIGWETDLKTSLRRMFQRKAPFQILGKVQKPADAGRAYAPFYHRYKKLIRLPKLLLPVAKQSYRWYRNARWGVGAKPLVNIYTYE